MLVLITQDLDNAHEVRARFEDLGYDVEVDGVATGIFGVWLV